MNLSEFPEEAKRKPRGGHGRTRTLRFLVRLSRRSRYSTRNSRVVVFSSSLFSLVQFDLYPKRRNVVQSRFPRSLSRLLCLRRTRSRAVSLSFNSLQIYSSLRHLFFSSSSLDTPKCFAGTWSFPSVTNLVARGSENGQRFPHTQRRMGGTGAPPRVMMETFGGLVCPTEERPLEF